ncbi:MAG: hypothetical protein ACE5JX_13150 [Acidobacteriota bacterium]
MSELFLSGRRRRRFEVLRGVLVPRSRAFTDAQRSRGRELVNEFVGRTPAATQRKLARFLILIDVLSILRGLRPFRLLPEAKQRALLNWLFDCPVGLLRKGFWGLNTIAKLSVYGQSSIYDDLGYRLRRNTDGSPE